METVVASSAVFGPHIAPPLFGIASTLGPTVSKDKTYFGVSAGSGYEGQ